MKPSDIYYRNHWVRDFRTDLPRFHEIESLRKSLSVKLDLPSVHKFIEPINSIKEDLGHPVDFSGDTVRFGVSAESINSSETLYNALSALIPWRKGPFEYFGEYIDTEWKSNKKWDRIVDRIPNIEGKRICDIGCNNGYYMYRLLSKGEPELLWGLDPMIRYYFYFQFHQKFYRHPSIQYDIFGVEHMDLFPDFFDIVLFMGVIYHRRNPVETLQKIACSIKSGGTLILESSGIPGDQPYCLFPEERYLKAPGYWFLPTASALINMLKRTGFKDIELFDQHKLEFLEQRQTPWAPFQSLEHFLDPEDSSLTVEGYPAPERIYISAKKK